MSGTVTATGDYTLGQGLGISASDPWPPSTYEAGVVVLPANPSTALTVELDGTVTVTDNNTNALTTDSIDGILDVTGIGNSTGPVSTASLVRIGATGVVNVTNGGVAQSRAYGYFSEAGFAAFENDGSITVSGASSIVIGVDMSAISGPFAFHPGASVVNKGSIDVNGAIATGVELGHGATLNNSGTITTHNGGVAVSADWSSDGTSTIVNSGHIVALQAPSGGSAGIAGGSYTLINSGLVSGVFAVQTNGSAATPGALTLTNTGTIDGIIEANSVSSAQIHNAGAINGNIQLEDSGDNLYDGRGGTLNGVLVLGNSHNTVFLGNKGEVVQPFYGAVGSMTLLGGTGADTVQGGGGNDVIDGGGGNDTLDGGGGINTVSFASSPGSVGVSLLEQNGAQDIGVNHWVTLSNFQNMIGSTHSDILLGDGNSNVIDGGGGDDVIDGGGGVNTVSFASATAGVTVSLALQGQAQATGAGSDTLSHFQNLTGSTHADHLTGDANDNVIDGGGGDDVIDGGGGVNTLLFDSARTGVTVSLTQQGHAQNTGVGSETLANIQNVIGSAFNDTLEGDGNGNLLDGAGGTNTVSYAHAASGVNVSLLLQGQEQNTGGAGTDFLVNFQNLTGSAYADHLTGDANNNIIDGGGGNDVLDGGGGVNTVSFASATAGVTVSLALQGQAQNTGGGADTLANFQNLTGSAFNDTLEGDGNNNVLDGGAGTNTVSYAHAGAAVTVSLALQGQAQNTLGAGTDTLSNFQALAGSAFGDTLEGGGEASSALTGGLGADTFVYQSGDGNVAVTDFSDVQGDKIDLSHLGQFFHLSDVIAASSQVGSDTIIAIGSGSLTLKNVAVAGLTAANFVFNAGSLTVGPGIGGTPTIGSGTINGTPTNNWLQGGAGNDTLHGGAGSDYLDGGGGLNTALYDGVLRQYTVSPSATAISGSPKHGIDFLANIQRVQFVDGYLATSPTDYAGQVYRVYEATLGRAPDPEGLATWVHALSNGTSLQTVVNGFVGSQEFQSDYGNLSNSDFATLLYNNVLHRAPDDAGLAGWVSALNSGQATRAQVVLDFSESQEDIGDSTAAVQKGLWIADTGAGEAARLYDTVFGRLPDEPGLATWTQSLDGGTGLQTAAADFVASAEFQSKYGALNDNDFVALLYNNVLHRAPDTAGLNSWLATLASGTARAQVVLDFSESQEHIADTAPHIDYGVWVAS